MAGQEGLEPTTSGFGDRRSTIRATGLHGVVLPNRLLGFLVNSVTATEGTVLLELQFVCSGPLVLCS